MIDVKFLNKIYLPENELTSQWYNVCADMKNKPASFLNPATLEQLSKKSGIVRGDISKLENGNANPSLKTLKRLASAMGKTLKIEFI